VKTFEYSAPKTIAEAVAILSKMGDRARILAGGTDLLVQVREGRRSVGLILDIKNMDEVNQLQFDPKQGLTLGAAVPCYRVCENAAIAKVYPGLIDAVSLIGGVQIQSRASVGGNLCNASPAADTIPALIAHEATCVIAGPNGTRQLPVEQFCTGPGHTVLQRGEFLVKMRIPAPKPHFGASYLRFIPRNEMDIAVVGVGAALTLDAIKARCTSARIALAAVAPTPLLAADAGAALVDGELNDTLIDKAAALAQSVAKPISDMRGDADYRKHLVGVLVRRAVGAALGRARGS
jgi:CO/xanthine dehydrogenase FAD-binding subunit